jgi:hypothetical protein
MNKGGGLLDACGGGPRTPTILGSSPEGPFWSGRGSCQKSNFIRSGWVDTALYVLLGLNYPHGFLLRKSQCHSVWLPICEAFTAKYGKLIGVKM